MSAATMSSRLERRFAPSRSATALRLAEADDLLIVCDIAGHVGAASQRARHAATRRVFKALSRLMDTGAVEVVALRDDARNPEVTAQSSQASIKVMDVSGAGEPTEVARRKYRAIDDLLADRCPSVILHIGDDDSDEVVFSALGVDDISCRVGADTSSATQVLATYDELIALLVRVGELRRCAAKPAAAAS
jgi:hypothetical protein